MISTTSFTHNKTMWTTGVDVFKEMIVEMILRENKNFRVLREKKPQALQQTGVKETEGCSAM